MAQSIAEVLNSAVKQSHWLLNATFEDVDQELANRPAPGNANPLGTAYAHIALAEDAVVNTMIQGKEPAFATTRAGRTGVDRPMPMPGMVEGDMGEWYHRAQVDLEVLRPYAAEVFAATEEFVAGLSDEALGRTIDLTFAGLGSKSVADVITMLVIQHCDNFSGEISAIKGVFGLKGYPF
ncbi:MAG: DinB family protein [Actinomycetota bacterium]